MEEKYGVLWRRRAREGELALICERRCRTYTSSRAVFQFLNENAISDGTFVVVKIQPPSKVVQLREVKFIGRIHLRKGKSTVKVPVLPQVRMDRGDKVVVESTLMRNPTAPKAYLPLNPEDRLRSFRHKQRVEFSLIVSVREMFRKHNPPFLDVQPVLVRPHKPKEIHSHASSVTYYKTNSGIAPADERPVCWYYAKKGSCRFGSACRNSHPDPATSANEGASGVADWFQRRSGSARGNMEDWLLRRTESPRLPEHLPRSRSAPSGLGPISAPVDLPSLANDPSPVEEPAPAAPQEPVRKRLLVPPPGFDGLELDSLPPTPREGSPEPDFESAILNSNRSFHSAGSWINTPSGLALDLEAAVLDSTRSEAAPALDTARKTMPAEIASDKRFLDGIVTGDVAQQEEIQHFRFG